MVFVEILIFTWDYSIDTFEWRIRDLQLTNHFPNRRFRNCGCQMKWESSLPCFLELIQNCGFFEIEVTQRRMEKWEVCWRRGKQDQRKRLKIDQIEQFGLIRAFLERLVKVESSVFLYSEQQHGVVQHTELEIR